MKSFFISTFYFTICGFFTNTGATINSYDEHSLVQELCEELHSYCSHLVPHGSCAQDAAGLCRKTLGLCPKPQEEAPHPHGVQVKYKGCFYEATSMIHVYNKKRLPKARMTASKCAQYCHAHRSTRFVALEAGKYCFCLGSVDALKRNPKGCSTKCTGNNNEVCGGFQRDISVYRIVSGEEGESSDTASERSVATPGMKRNKQDKSYDEEIQRRLMQLFRMN